MSDGAYERHGSVSSSDQIIIKGNAQLSLYSRASRGTIGCLWKNFVITFSFLV